MGLMKERGGQRNRKGVVPITSCLCYDDDSKGIGGMDGPHSRITVSTGFEDIRYENPTG